MSATTYHQPQRARRGDSDFVMSRTELRAFAENPHAWVQGELEIKPSGAMLFGSLVDAMLLDREELKRYIWRPETYFSKAKTKAEKDKADADGNIEKPWNGNSKTCRDWMQEQAAAGRVVVNNYAFQLAEKAARLARENSAFGAMLSGAQTQVVLEWSYLDAETGIEVPLKAMVDLVPPAGAALVDLKTAMKADPRGFEKAVWQNGYYYQAGFYLWGWRECRDSNRNIFAWHVIETGGCSPDGVPARKSFTQGTYVCAADYAAIGIDHAKRDLARYARCLADGKFPEYTDKPKMIEAPKWAGKEIS